MNINYYNITSTVLSSVYLHYWWLLFLCDTTTATIIMTIMMRMTRRMVIITQHNLREHFYERECACAYVHVYGKEGT